MRPDQEKEFAEQTGKNFTVWGKNVGFPAVEVLTVLPDRVFFGWHSGCLDWCKEHMDPWNIMIKEHRALGTNTARDGFRERVPFFAVQIIRHVVDGQEIGEWDVDEGNPGMGLLPLTYHALSFLWYRMKKKLGKPGILNPFLVERHWRKHREGWVWC